VIARNTAFTFKGKPIDAKAIGGLVKSLLGEEPAEDPLVTKGKEVAAKGRVGMMVTTLETAEDLSGVKVEVVDEGQVRAKRDHTRVFLPMNAEVLDFFNNLGKWFLHFSEPESLGKAILPKKNAPMPTPTKAIVRPTGQRSPRRCRVRTPSR
jgi:hypothetical protein